MGGGALAAFTQALRRRFDTPFFESMRRLSISQGRHPAGSPIIVIPWTVIYLVDVFLRVAVQRGGMAGFAGGPH
jgi:hypothetical protein